MSVHAPRCAVPPPGIRARGISPSLSLRDVYPEGIYCPRPSPNAARWVSEDSALLNARAGAALGVSGGMPAMCSRGSATDRALDLLRSAGLQMPSTLYLFGAEAEYLAALAGLVRTGERLVIRHAHPAEEVPEANSWIPREILVRLNDKARLQELMLAGETARRSFALPAEARAVSESFGLPTVLKASTRDVPSTGGVGVRICRDRRALEQAVADLGACGEIIIEEFLDMTRSLCLNYAVMPDGTIRYLGSAEQVCDERGIYLGNWLDPAAEAPDEVIAMGRALGIKAATIGYRGFFAIDVAMFDDRPALAFDLNFRTNGSTAALLLYEGIRAHTAATTMRLRVWTGRRGFDALLQAAHRALRDGFFMPLSIHDPVEDGFNGAVPRLLGLMLGDSRSEVRDHEAAFTRFGAE